ncbi:MAG: glycoside hydrolase family 38 C-terminal domain-containing protein [Candidatus Electryonea clarkiae]|nr:glycoside hydrolase family 38 C-terminal domain-containing protein [Candidatus Electryonea clarkiae]MDP8289220.1 glycoside hydrolase family 38 C-terminal domain-containing protein [Candidatus Electryonea clarkiae]
MSSKTLILVCNSHIDPVWLWEWEEGLAETLSTFRTAARFCEEFDGFVFCHNEALLYEWVNEYEPELFSLIKKLVKDGKWHIMGGWYIQPDCNMPSGEAFVRQILYGRRYFKENFDVEPKTAINFDPFGHSRGLVQILKKSGYTSYLFCRPDDNWMPLSDNDFIWQGYDGSEILAHRALEHYNSNKGMIDTKINKWLEDNREAEFGILLWGIGNHGGGPSREDIQKIESLKTESKEWDISHGTPEEYFTLLETKRESLPIVAHDLNPWAVGCYTSMARIKQKYRNLENIYFLTEKMLTVASLQGFIGYPYSALQIALEDLLFCQFHDILPGSSTSEVESYVIQRVDHALEILNKLKAKAFFSLLSGQNSAVDGEYPIYIFNPHPCEYEETLTCEFQPPEPDFDMDNILLPEIKDSEGNIIPVQLEKESSNISLDHRKRIVFRANLKPSSMNRFSCKLNKTKIDNINGIYKNNGNNFRFGKKSCIVEIEKLTGLLKKYSVDGYNYLQSSAMKLLVMKDYPDPWGMKVRSFRDIEGEFTLMTPIESAEFAGVPVGRLEPVRIIEEGDIRTIVEALFKYNNSTLCLRYKIPKKGNEIEIEVRVFWMEKDKMLKLSIPTEMGNCRCKGQVAYGTEDFNRPGDELVAQRWVALFSPDEKNALSIINDRTYGFDFKDGELRLSLLRSPAYSGHPVEGVEHIVPDDRFEPRIDQGEHIFHFWMNAGEAGERLSSIDREAMIKNEPGMVLCCYPPGSGKKALPGIILSNPVIQLAAFKMAENKDKLIIRLFEPIGKPGTTIITIPYLDIEFEITLSSFEIKTISVDIPSKSYSEVDLLEN